MPAREIAELLMAGAGGAFLAELGSTLREGRAAKRARRDGDELARLVDHERVVHLESQLAHLEPELERVRLQIAGLGEAFRAQSAAMARLEELGTLLGEMHELLVTVVVNHRDDEVD